MSITVKATLHNMSGLRRLNCHVFNHLCDSCSLAV